MFGGFNLIWWSGSEPTLVRIIPIAEGSKIKIFLLKKAIGARGAVLEDHYFWFLIENGSPKRRRSDSTKQLFAERIIILECDHAIISLLTDLTHRRCETL